MIELTIPVIAFWFAAVTGVPQRIPLLKRKPFTCSKCMAFWLSLAWQIKLGFTLESVVIIAISSLSAWLLEVICVKLQIPFNR